MIDDEPTFLSQDVSYLGFLEGQLRDFQGTATLAFELIQNADDALDSAGRPQSSWIRFDVSDEALIVTNDGVFRQTDFDRLRLLAGGGKRDEAGTTGAFGLGFVAVFQVTDAPEILSAGRHWTIRPDAAAERRIVERPAETENTTFRLPWATDPASPVRRALRLPAILPGQLDALAHDLAVASRLAALFLKQLTTLEVRRRGELVEHVSRERVGDDRLQLRAAGTARRWLLARADFAVEAEALRTRYPWQIEAKRRSDVRLAIPLDEPLARGHLFAVLPLEQPAPLPFHVNADFYPTSDRKRLQLEAGYQAEWNVAAVRAAATALRQVLDDLPRELGPVGLWRLLQQVADTARLAVNGEAPEVLGDFWREVAPRLPDANVVQTLDDSWRRPAETRRWAGRVEPKAAPLLATLGLALVHPDMAPFDQLLGRPEVGVPSLSVADVAACLSDVGLVGTVPLAAAPAALSDSGAWPILWRVLDRLLGRPAFPDDVALLRPCALVLTRRMTLTRLDRVYRGRSEIRDLFPEVDWLHETVPADTFPGSLTAEFGARHAVDWLREQPVDRLEHAWRLGRLDVAGLFRWLESRQIEIFADDPALRGEIRRLPIVPVAGALRPLEDLFLPGDFEDPLQLAGIVEPDAVGGRRAFLRDLGVRELDFDIYLRRQLPRALADPGNVPSDALHRLVAMLAARLGALRDDDDLRRLLADLPLVACLDGSFRPAPVVFRERAARELLGDLAHVAEPAPTGAVAELHRWLGVRDMPEPTDIVAMLIAFAQAASAAGEPTLPAESARQARRGWAALGALIARDPEGAEAMLEPLLGLASVPDGQAIMRRPDQLLLADGAELAEHFPALADLFLDPEAPEAAALAAAGARRMSRAVSAVLVPPESERAAPALEARLHERAALIEQVVAAAGVNWDEGTLPGGVLASLEVRWAAPLAQRYRLQLADGAAAGIARPVSAWLDADRGVLYVAEGQEPPWSAIAGALARAVTGGRAASLALAIRAVLAEETTAGARRLLDELG